MPITTRLSEVAHAAYLRRKAFLFTTFAFGALIALIGSASSQLPGRTVMALFGFAGLGLVWSWGAFLLSYWFRPQTTLSPRLRTLAAGFLAIWFIVGSIGFVTFIVAALLASGADSLGGTPPTP